MSIQLDGITADAGTYTVHIGRGVSDPVPYKAPAQQHEAAILQAHARNEQIENIERLARLVADMEWARHAHPHTDITYQDVEGPRRYLQELRQENDARP